MNVLCLVSINNLHQTILKLILTAFHHEVSENFSHFFCNPNLYISTNDICTTQRLVLEESRPIIVYALSESPQSIPITNIYQMATASQQSRNA
ncbi:MAG: hypothetical protein CVU43_21705 [Chloroflexi bacterium HGW-Chloroflexi-5]|jgi:hypothetical protein|nr:MAG: hypothetical protein CVU43_21705 [Chloroflexi bacterium HGW-Chloroflexi-5]